MQPDLPQRLGLTRAMVLHVDDLGSTHAANRAYLDLAGRSLVTCGSVMVPCPWFREIAEAAVADPGLDLGVHLTLTSEWPHYRWAPISTTSRASGLIDDDSYFWRDVASLHRHLVPEAAEAELRAQIERALAAGMTPTHIDAHMAAAMLPDLLEVHVRLADTYGLFPVLPRTIDWAPDPRAYQEMLACLDQAGRPVVDHCRGTLAVTPAMLATEWRRVVTTLPPGITHVALHCTALGEFAAIAPDHAIWRQAEYDLVASGALADFCAASGVSIIGTRDLQRLWMASG
jgi:chitin disaccharide deacetylase